MKYSKSFITTRDVLLPSSHLQKRKREGTNQSSFTDCTCECLHGELLPNDLWDSQLVDTCTDFLFIALACGEDITYAEERQGTRCSPGYVLDLPPFTKKNMVTKRLIVEKTFWKCYIPSTQWPKDRIRTERGPLIAKLIQNDKSPSTHYPEAVKKWFIKRWTNWWHALQNQQVSNNCFDNCLNNSDNSDNSL